MEKENKFKTENHCVGSGISYSYITSRSRISLLLQETEC